MFPYRQIKSPIIFEEVTQKEIDECVEIALGILNEERHSARQEFVVKLLLSGF